MLDYSDFTIVKNTDGIISALGYPIQSLLLQSNKPLFVGGKKHINYSKSSDTMEFDHMAVPAGLVCMTETICTRPSDIDTGTSIAGTSIAGTSIAGTSIAGTSISENEYETIPDGLYEKLLALAETKPPKKLSRSKNIKKSKSKTRKR